MSHDEYITKAIVRGERKRGISHGYRLVNQTDATTNLIDTDIGEILQNNMPMKIIEIHIAEWRAISLLYTIEDIVYLQC